MRRGGWFKESVRHSLAAKGVSTAKYFSSKKQKFIRRNMGLPPLPSDYQNKERKEYVGDKGMEERPKTFRGVMLMLKRRDVLKDPLQREKLLYAEERLHSAQERLASLPKKADEEDRAALKRVVAQQQEVVTSMLTIQPSERVKLGAQTAEYLEKVAQRSGASRKGEATQLQEAQREARSSGWNESEGEKKSMLLDIKADDLRAKRKAEGEVVETTPKFGERVKGINSMGGPKKVLAQKMGTPDETYRKLEAQKKALAEAREGPELVKERRVSRSSEAGAMKKSGQKTQEIADAKKDWKSPIPHGEDDDDAGDKG